jgi:hypothetical protein
MPNIFNVGLEIVENQGAAAALVTYTIAFNSLDLGQSLEFIETVELIGDDTLGQEDQLDDPIPGSLTQNDVTLSFLETERKRLIALQGTALDEDKDRTGPLSADEIRARVTLSPRPGASVSAESGFIVLHQSKNGLSARPSAGAAIG